MAIFHVNGYHMGKIIIFDIPLFMIILIIWSFVPMIYQFLVSTILYIQLHTYILLVSTISVPIIWSFVLTYSWRYTNDKNTPSTSLPDSLRRFASTEAREQGCHLQSGFVCLHTYMHYNYIHIYINLYIYRLIYLLLISTYIYLQYVYIRILWFTLGNQSHCLPSLWECCVMLCQECACWGSLPYVIRKVKIGPSILLVGGWPTPLKNISQWEGLSHILWKIKNVWNHQPV